MDTQPVIVRRTTPPVPAKLAERIWNLEYVAMTDLLPKSLVEAEQLADSDKKKRKQKVQIRDIALWMQSFNTYTAVMSKRHPERVADLLAYSSQIVEASRQFKQIPWLVYDTKFRLQAAAQKRPGLADISTTLWTLAFAGAEPRERCQHCLQVDHPSSECKKPEPKETRLQNRWYSNQSHLQEVKPGRLPYHTL